MKGLIDSTLREGSQTFGVHFSLNDKKEIFTWLARTGIEEIELGVVSELDDDLPELLSFCRASSFSGRLALWCLCRESDISYAARLRPDVLSLSIPVSDLHITSKLGRDRDWVLATVRESITSARGLNFPVISMGLEDATRADRDFLAQVVQAACEVGVDRVRLADTVGIAVAPEIVSLVQCLKSDFTCEIGVHAHNDFGMATANSLAALDNGADWADVTVLGVGERAGNARLEELAGFLAIRRQRSYDLKSLVELVKVTAAATKREISPHHPVVGKEIFSCETGLHLQGLTKEPATYEPFSPELVGAQRNLRYGAKIGRKELKNQLAIRGLNMSPLQLLLLAGKVRQAAGQCNGRFGQKEKVDLSL